MGADGQIYRGRLDKLEAKLPELFSRNTCNNACDNQASESVNVCKGIFRLFEVEHVSQQ